MEYAWLGQISPPYESPQYQVAAKTRDGAKEAVLDELAGEYWQEKHDNPEWHESTETYGYLKDAKATVEVRRVEYVAE